jgi:hypothetical protein
MSTVIPFINPLLEQQNSAKVNSQDNFENVTKLPPWPEVNHPYFPMPVETMPGYTKSKYGFLVPVEEHDNECFTSLKCDLDEWFDQAFVNRTLDDVESYSDFVATFCPPTEYWVQTGSKNYSYWPSEGRYLLDELQMKREMIQKLRHELLLEEENNSDYE